MPPLPPHQKGKKELFLLYLIMFWLVYYLTIIICVYGSP